MTPEGGDGGTFELVLEPRTERFDADDDRWLEQVSLLFQELHREVGGVTRQRQPVEGTKGGAETVILAWDRPAPSPRGWRCCARG